MQRGFSLAEVLVAVIVTMIVATSVFQLFERNERLYRDQNLITEMQQGARAAISQISDEIRVAGQGVPRYAASFDLAENESTVAILSGSSSTRLNLRAGLAPAESSVTAPLPLSLTQGTPAAVTMDSVSGFYNAVGSSPTGRFLYVWGEAGTARWAWVRAAILSISLSGRSMQITPIEISQSGVAQFAVSPTVSLEEAIAIYRDSSGTLRHTTATNTANPASPVWAPANDMVTNVSLLQFDYFDSAGLPVVPDTLANRWAIARIDVRIVVESTQELSNHSRASCTLTVRTFIRSQTIH
jgi:Tfp pilus assembly protein PilW